MRVPVIAFALLLAVAVPPHPVRGQFWKYSQQLFNPFAWLRQGKTSETKTLSATIPSTNFTFPTTTSSPQQSGIAVSNGTKSMRTTLAASSSSSSTTTTTKRALKVKSTVSPSSSTHRVVQSSSKLPITASTQKTTVLTISGPTSSSSSTRQQQQLIENSTSSTHANGDVTSTISKSTSAIVGNATTEATLLLAVQERTAEVQDVDEDEAVEDEEETAGTTEEEPPRENHRQHDFYVSKRREKPQVKIAANISQNLLPLPAGASAALVKPTKYHYYPHNQHIYLLPECAIQQVCNAVYVRLNWTQPLCACPSRYRDPCSASLNSDDQHTTELQIDRNSRRALTLVKTCEPTTEMRLCRAPRDWSLLALQNIRTGKSHYLVICRCQDSSVLEGPMSHDQPTYASVPGIRVYGMMCVQSTPATTASNNIKRRGRPLRMRRAAADNDLDDSTLEFPWDKAIELAQTVNWDEED